MQDNMKTIPFHLIYVYTSRKIRLSKVWTQFRAEAFKVLLFLKFSKQQVYRHENTRKTYVQPCLFTSVILSIH